MVRRMILHSCFIIFLIFYCDNSYGITFSFFHNKDTIAHEFFDPLVRQNLELLNSHKISDRKVAVARLGGLKAEVAVDRLIALIEEDSVKDVIRLSVSALGNIGDSRAIPSIRKVIGFSDPAIKKEAVFALLKFENDRIWLISKELFYQEYTCREYLLNAMNRSVFWRERISGDSDFFSYILSYDDDNQIIKIAIAGLLGNMDHKKSQETLLRFLNSDDDQLQIEAAHSLGKIKCENAVIGLKEMLKDPNTLKQCAAAGALASIGEEEGFIKLKKLLRSENEQIRWNVLKELGKEGGPRSMEILRAYVDEEKEQHLVRTALRILQKSNLN